MNLPNSLMIAALLVPVLFSGTAHSKSQERIHIRQVQSDIHFRQKSEEVSRTLKRRGFEVKKINADSYEGQAALDIEALKDGQKYEIKMAYPSLKILKQKRDGEK